jgi:hypothetical protein
VRFETEEKELFLKVNPFNRSCGCHDHSPVDSAFTLATSELLHKPHRFAGTESTAASGAGPGGIQESAERIRFSICCEDTDSIGIFVTQVTGRDSVIDAGYHSIQLLIEQL